MTTNGKSQTRYDDAQLIFNNVLRSLEHEDAKANRLIVAMAFITAASAAVFVHLHDPSTSAWEFGLSQMGWMSVLFCLYVGLVILGVLFFMSALGPRLNIPSEWTEKSRLFFWKIAEYSKEEWIAEIIKSDPEKLRNLITYDLALEARMLAQKNRYKVVVMGAGRFLFRYSFVFMGAFIAFGLGDNGILSLGIAIFTLSVILFHHTFEVSFLPENLKKSGFLSWRLMFVGLFCSNKPFVLFMLISALSFLVISFGFIIWGGVN